MPLRRLPLRKRERHLPESKQQKRLGEKGQLPQLRSPLRRSKPKNAVVASASANAVPRRRLKLSPAIFLPKNYARLVSRTTPYSESAQWRSLLCLHGR